MAVYLLGASGLTFGLLAETSGLIQNLEIRKTRQKATVMNQIGEIAAAAYYDPSEEVTLEFYTTGSSDIAAAAPGVALTAQNYTPSAGLLITEETTTTRPNNDYKKMSLKCVVHPLITS